MSTSRFFTRTLAFCEFERLQIIEAHSIQRFKNGSNSMNLKVGDAFEWLWGRSPCDGWHPWVGENAAKFVAADPDTWPCRLRTAQCRGFFKADTWHVFKTIFLTLPLHADVDSYSVLS